MLDAGQTHGADAQAFLPRFLEIHESQTRSARADLDRLKRLIEDAGERLMASFNLIGEIAAQHAVQSDAAHGMAEAVDNAVSALQFQDMAQQLLGHAAKRIEVLERITAPLARLPDASAQDLSVAVQGTVYQRSNGNGPVEQACMDGGSVELF